MISSKTMSHATPSMTEGQSQLEKPYAWASKYDLTIEGLLALLLLFAPFAFGAVQAWSELMLLALVAGMVLALAGRQLFERHSSPCRWSPSYLLIIAFLALVAFQLFSLPWPMLGAISPVTASLKGDLLADLPGGAPATGTLSFYAFETRHQLRILLAVAAIFFIVTNTFRHRDQIRRLLIVIASVGGAVTLLALYRNLNQSDTVYGIVPNRFITSGPFQNYNHYSQFTNLSMGAALALLLLEVERRVGSRSLAWHRLSDLINGSRAGIVWSVLAMLLAASVSVALSTSRMGFISMLVAAVVVGVLFSRSRHAKGRGSVLILIGFGFFCLLLVLGFESIYDRLATLQKVDAASSAYSARWQTLVDLWPMWFKFPIFGTGLGSHAWVFHMFDRSNDFVLTSHVENEYAQLMEEMGLSGLLLALAFIAFIICSGLRAIRSESGFAASVALGLGFGLVAILVHSFSDFAQHVPGIACLTAVVCGLLVNLSPARWGKQPVVAKVPHHPTRSPLPFIVTGIAMLLFAWNLLAARAAFDAESASTSAQRIEQRLASDDWQADDIDFARLLLCAQEAADAQPGNIALVHALDTYRWRTIARARDAQTGALVLDEDALEYTRRLTDELSASRALCPTYGPPFSLMGQIEKFVFELPVGEQHIATGYRLTPYDAACCYAAGLVDVFAQRWDDSLVKFGRLAVAGEFRTAAGIYITTANRPDLAITLAGDDISRLLTAASLLQQAEGTGPLNAKGPVPLSPLALTARQTAIAKLRPACDAPDATADMLASMARISAAENDHASAIGYYRRALDKDYGKIDWRLALARSLAKVGQVDPAIDQVRICLRLRPKWPSAVKLLGDLSVLPGAGGTTTRPAGSPPF